MSSQSTTARELDPDVIVVALSDALPGRAPRAKAAFSRLYAHYATRVRHAVARAAVATHYQHRIDELVQDVWYRFLDNDRRLLRYFDARRGPFGPFAARLAYQQALLVVQLDRRRGVPANHTHVAPDDAEDHATSQFVAELIQSDFYEKLMARAELELDDKDHLLLREVYAGGRTCRAVAQAHDINENTLYKRHQRLKDRLRGWAEDLMQQRRSRSPAPSLAVLIAVIVAGLTSLALEPDRTSASVSPDPDAAGDRPSADIRRSWP
ncbi:MAG: hypothetical protein K0V04_08955 [Deltaproteobacteria bacterium]|nr:hypothetical protein [Deltaproteobacteria bacterium]